MRNLYKIHVVVLTLLLLSCRNSDAGSSPPNQLPPATQAGKNTAGCLVNGTILLPRGQKIQNGPVLSCFYQYLNDGYHFGLGINDNSGSELKGIGIGTNNIILKAGATYILGINPNDSSSIDAFGYYGGPESMYQFNTTDECKGELKITYIDTINYIISGTFWFNAIDKEGRTIKVSDGRFDVHYAP